MVGALYLEIKASFHEAIISTFCLVLFEVLAVFGLNCILLLKFYQILYFRSTLKQNSCQSYIYKIACRYCTG